MDLGNTNKHYVCSLSHYLRTFKLKRYQFLKIVAIDMEMIQHFPLRR